MNDETGEEVFTRVAKEIEANQKIVNRQVSIVLVTLAASAVLVFIGFQFLKDRPELSCRFVDNETLLRFWPPNTAIIDALKSSRYSQPDQCLLIATRSIASMTMLPVVMAIFVRRLFASDRFHVKGRLTVFVVLLLAAFLTAYTSPSDDNLRYGLNFMSSIGVNVLKSMYHIFGFYFCALILAFWIPVYLRSIRR